MNIPLVFRWHDGVMRPTPQGLSHAQKLYDAGGYYKLVEHEEPSDQQRKWYFALVETAHQHMPHGLESKWPTKDHLRWWALTFTPYRRTIPWDYSTAEGRGKIIAMLCGQSQQLVRGTRWFRMEEDDRHPFTVLQHFPLSQRAGLMDAKAFHDAANLTLDVICTAVRIPLDTLEKMARHTT